MKRYRLLKDLPTFNKGDTFLLDEDIRCLVREKDWVVAYAPYTLEKFNILDSDWFEEIPEEYKRWRAKRNDFYYWLTEDLEAVEETEDGGAVDEKLHAIGNYFKTEEEAKKASDWLKAFTTLRDDTKGFKPDWKNPDQRKWVVRYDNCGGGLVIDYFIQWNFGSIVFFATEADAEASVRNHKREWLTFFGVEE